MNIRLIDPLAWRMAARDPLVWLGLAVDLLPVMAVVFLGWRAGPLIVLYWLENGVIGVFAILRMLTVGASKGLMVLIAIFMSGFFAVHYGLFWFVHGIFVLPLAAASKGGEMLKSTPAPNSPVDLGILTSALQSYPYMDYFLLIIVTFAAIVYVVDFIVRGEYQRAALDELMSAPYVRVVVLHVGIFAGAFALLAMGEPAAGVLLLILMHAAWGMYMRIRRYAPVKVDAASDLPSA